MATRYTELVAKVRNWSNRDEEVLGDSLVNDCLEYAADDAYRILRIPALEAIHRYSNITQEQIEAGTVRTLTIPSDLSSFIQLRREQNDSGGGQLGFSPYIVYTAKEDIRSFYDVETCKPDYFRWTREQNQIVVYPNYSVGDIFELYYYRRLPPLDSVFVVNAANAAGLDPTLLESNNGFLRVVPMPTTEMPNADACELFYTGDGTDASPYAFFDAQDDMMTRMSFWAVGLESPNWLKDNHERTLLYGSLKYAFSYLQEPEHMQQYEKLFLEELAKLNDEENLRRYQGGGTVVNFATGGLI